MSHPRLLHNKTRGKRRKPDKTHNARATTAPRPTFGVRHSKELCAPLRKMNHGAANDSPLAHTSTTTAVRLRSSTRAFVGRKDATIEGFPMTTMCFCFYEAGAGTVCTYRTVLVNNVDVRSKMACRCCSRRHSRCPYRPCHPFRSCCQPCRYCMAQRQSTLDAGYEAEAYCSQLWTIVFTSTTILLRISLENDD
jgi:hypothetical protein